MAPIKLPVEQLRVPAAPGLTTMWALVIFGLLAGATASRPNPTTLDPPVWLPGRTFHYSLEAKSLNAMHQVNDKYVGVLWKGNLTIQRRNDTSISVKITSLEFAEVDHDIPGGWSSDINQEEYRYQQFPMVLKQFELGMNKTSVSNFTADRNAPTWERNVGKAIATALNIDAMGNRGNGDDNTISPYAVFTKLEGGVTGKCVVRYAINPIPKYIAVSQPKLGDPKNWQENSVLLDVSKSTNYTQCTKRPVTLVGLGSQGSVRTMKNVHGTAFSISTLGRAILSGSPYPYRIQYSTVETQFSFYPLHYRQQKGMGGSQISIRLEKVQETSVQPPEVDNPLTSPDLVYEYPQGQQLRQQQGAKYGRLAEDSSSSSSSGSDDSENSSQGSSSSGESENSNESSKSDEYQDSESSSSEEQSARRPRRSLKYLSPDYFRQSPSSEESSSSSSSFESTSSSEEAARHLLPKTYMSQAPVFPFSKQFLGRKGQPLTYDNDVDVIGGAVRILREIGSDMLCTEEITTRNIPEKFIRVRNLIRLLNVTGMLKVAEKVRPGSSDSQEAENTWTAFIYASTQSGTKPALLAITQLIKRGVVEPELQGPALAFLARYAVFPTRDYIETFWDLLQSSEVRKRQSVYGPGTLAFGDMLHFGTVVRNAPGNLEHVYGKPLEGKDKFIADEYIDKLAEFLRKSLRANRTFDVQLYIRTIGNIGSDKVAEVFEPYFSGDEYSTSFQRQSMVMALERLGQRNSTLGVQQVYQNIASPGEDSAVRSLSCFMFMSFNPTLAEMVKMAQHLLEERDKHVIRACTTALLAASKLEGPEYEQLAKDAQAATKVMATNITGIQRSSEYWINHEVSELNLQYEAKLFLIGSKDTIRPKGIEFSSARRLGGFKEPLGKIFASTTSIRDLTESILEQIITDDSDLPNLKPLSGSIPFTLDDINKHFKVKTDLKEALRAILYTDFLNTPSLITHDNKTISYFAEGFKELARNASKGLNFNWLKFVVTDQLLYGFPNSLGLPSSSSLVKPVILSINGNLTATTTPDVANSPVNFVVKPHTMKGKIKATIAVSTMSRGEVSVVFPFKDSTAFNAGYKSKTLLNIPIEATIYIDLKNNFLSLKIEPLKENEKQRVLHLSQVPYVYSQQISDLSQPRLNVIHKRKPIVWSEKYGQETTGLVFQVDYLSELIPGGRKLPYSIFNENLLKSWTSPFAEPEIGLRNVSVYFLRQQSPAESVVIRAYTAQRQNDDEDSGSRRSHPRNLKRGRSSSNEQSDLLDAALSGIEHGQGSLVNVSVEFEGRKSARYSVAVASAESPIDTTSRILAKLEWRNVTAPKTNKALLNLTTEFPPVPVMSLDNVSPNGTAIIRLNTTQGMEISATMYVQRTLARQQYIENAPLTQVCKGQMERGNKVQFACRNSTVMKYFLNKYELTGSYSNLNLAFANATFKVYQHFVQRYFPLTSVNVVNATGKPGRFAGWATVNPDRSSVNVSVVVSNVLNANITNIRLSRYAANLLMTHPRYTTSEIARNMLTRGQANATCAVDRSLVNTFDNSTYSVKIGDCWTNVLLTTRRRNANGTVPTPGTPEELALLIRSTGENSREIKILSAYDEVILKPSSMGPQGAYRPIEVIVNGQKFVVKKGDYRKVNGRDQTPLLVTFAEYDALTMEIFGMILNFDGQRLLLQAEDQYRDSIRGLCGTFDGQRKTDLKVPRNCILGNETAFVQEFIFPKECKAVTPLPQYNICVKEVIRVGNDTSEPEIVSRVPTPRQQQGPASQEDEDEDEDEDQSDDSSDVSSDVTSDRHMEFRTMVKEFGGKLCFSVRPVRYCNDKSKPKALSDESVTFHCVAKSEAAHKWAEKVRRGEVLDFLLKKKGHSSHTVSLPKSCKPLH